MINILRSEERGNADYGWLKTFHTFSFADYFNRKRMNYRSLRVINEDFVASGQGFPTHPHANMEIFTYIIDGELAHKDSMGNVKIVKKDEVQAMSAGSGVTHSEFNPSDSNPVHLLQIWIMPSEKGLAPSYGEWRQNQKENGLTLFASPDERDGSLKINQDSQIYVGNCNKDTTLDYKIEDGRGVWLQLISGEIIAGDNKLTNGDALSVENQNDLHLKFTENSKFLLFDLGAFN